MIKNVKKVLLSVAVVVMLVGATFAVSAEVLARTELRRQSVSSSPGQNRSGSFTINLNNTRRLPVNWAHSQFQIWGNVNSPTVSGSIRIAGGQAEVSNGIVTRRSTVLTEERRDTASAEIMRVAGFTPRSTGILFDR